MKKWLIMLSVLVSTFVGIVIAKQSVSPNTRIVNQEDGLTAGELSKHPADILMTKKIRTELLNDDALSMKAKNIRIIVINNGVTLKGNVADEKERARILEHAYITAPKHKIYNQISVVK